MEETLCLVGTGPASMAFKEKEVPDTLSATKGLVGETIVRDFGRVWVHRIYPADPSWLYSTVEIGAPSKVFMG